MLSCLRQIGEVSRRRGVDVLRIDAVPYIWKELGTDCRNLPRRCV